MQSITVHYGEVQKPFRMATMIDQEFLISPVYEVISLIEGSPLVYGLIVPKTLNIERAVQSTTTRLEVIQSWHSLNKKYNRIAILLSMHNI